MDNPRNIVLFAVCMIFLTLVILLVFSIGVHNIVNGKVITFDNSSISTTIDPNNPDIPTLIHDNDTDQ